MSYLVLARKYRPRTFADVVGQESVVRALANALDQQRLHHAYLFTGTRGVGKTTLARILAACLNCERGITSTPCGECVACRQIASGSFIDLIEVDAASRTGVDDTRELLSNAQFLPGQGRCKVYLIDEVHMLTGHSFNALLKTLEEPPEHVKFLLATTEAKKIPVTVLSRCLQFNLKNMLPEVIEAQLTKVLEEEGIAAEPAALATIARAAAGSMRDALSITDQAISHGGGAVAAASVGDMLGIAGRDEIGALLDALAAHDSARLLAAGDELAARSLDLATLLGDLQRAFHDLALAAELDTAPAPPYERFKDAFAAEDLQLYYQIALLGGRDLTFAPDPKVGFDMTLIRLASFEPQAEEASPDANRGGRTGQNGQGGNGQSRQEPPKPAGQSKPRQAAAAPAPAAAPPPAPAAAPSPPPVAEQKAPPERKAPPASAPPLDAGEQTAQTDDDWPAIVHSIGARGVAKMILDNTNLLTRSDERWLVLLDETNASLLNDKRRGEIARLASAFQGREVAVEFQMGKPNHETPAQNRQRQQQQQQAQAEALLMNDANVQSLLKEFDGRLEAVRLANTDARRAAP